MEDVFQIVVAAIILLSFVIQVTKKAGEKKKEQEPQNVRPGLISDPSETEPTRKVGLQQRLEDALKQMEQRVATESAEGGAQNRAPQARSTANPLTANREEQVHLGPDRSNIVDDPDAVSREIDRMAAGALFDREEVAASASSLTPTPTRGRKMHWEEEETVDDDPGFYGVPESPEMVARIDTIGPSSEAMSQGGPLSQGGAMSQGRAMSSGPGLSSTFKVAHGLHYEEGFDPLRSETEMEPEFHEAHGLHYNEPHSAHDSLLPPPRPDDGPRFTPADMRRAVVMAEVLGKPVSRRRSL